MKSFYSISRRILPLPLLPLLTLWIHTTPGPASADTLVDAVHRGDGARMRSLLASQPDLSEADADGNTALHWAALHGDAGLVRELLKLGAPVNAMNSVEATPLLYSVGNLDAVRALLEYGADVNQASRFKSTPLMAATRYSKSSDVVRLLLSHGAALHRSANGGSTPVDNAAYAGDLETVKLLISAGQTPRSVTRPAMMGHLEIVEAALAAGSDLKINGGFAGHALNFALYGQQPAIAKFLIEQGADLKLRSPAGQHETPPILWAAYNESGDASVASLMIKAGVDVNMQSVLGESALDWARARNNTALEAVLLQAGAREVTAARKVKVIPDRHVPQHRDALNVMSEQSITRAISLLQQSSDGFLRSGVVKQKGCVSCHQQTLTAVPIAWARERGLVVDNTSVARQVQDQILYWTRGNRIPKTYEMIRPQPDWPVLLGYGLWGLSALGYPADALTEAMVWFLAATQNSDGSWPAADYRPPMEDGPIQGTAFAIRAFQLYPLPGREAEIRQRILRARSYLSKARPISFNQQVFQLLGLGWAGESIERLQPLAAAVLEKQAPDGGWAQLDGLPSDAWATGQALVALNTVGGVAVSDSVYQQGLRFLLRTQFEDGSWYVRSRAWPFQPHFESGFPHGKDQWISAGGTAWASMALLLTQPKREDVTGVNWMALKIPNEEQPSDIDTARPAMSAQGKRKVDFVRDIQPFLDRSCGACHGTEAKRKKGGFSITSDQAILKGGQSGNPVVMPGNSSDSQLIRMVTDQVEDLEMPPPSKREKYPVLSSQEVELLKTWIDESLGGEMTAKDGR